MIAENRAAPLILGGDCHWSGRKLSLGMTRAEMNFHCVRGRASGFMLRKLHEQHW